MFPFHKKRLLLLGMLGVLLAACAPQAEKLWLKSPGWSRGVLIGNTRVGDTVSIAVDDDSRVFLFYVENLNEIPTLRLVTLDDTGALIASHDFTEVTLNRPSRPEIYLVADGLRAFWINDKGLYTALISSTGEFLEPPNLISGSHNIDGYDSSQSAEGDLAIWFYAAPDQPGLYGGLLSHEGLDSVLIDAEGVGAEIQFDERGDLHALWKRNPTARGANDFIYAAFSRGIPQSQAGEVVVSPIIYGTTSLDGPHLGLDDSYAYAFWSLTFFTGPEAGTTEAYYVSFPRGDPGRASRAAPIAVPWLYELEYQEGDAPLNTGPRVPISIGSMGGGAYLLQITPNDRTSSELIVALFSRVSYLMRKVQGQVNAIYFDDGLPTGYQQLSFSPGISSTPKVTNDARGYVYLTWLEKGELPGWVIYFASTSPKIIENYASLTMDDVGRLSAEIIFGMVSSALLVPVGLIWILAGALFLVVINRLTRRFEEQHLLRTYVPLLTAIIIVWVIKMGVVPGILEYVPFSAWVPNIPAWLEPWLRIFVPILIFVLGWLAAVAFVGEKISETPNRFFLIYCAVDAVLTMAIYGVLVVIGA